MTYRFEWQPPEECDLFLGDPVYFDPNVEEMVQRAKRFAGKDWSEYYQRDIEGRRIERDE
jgi:hypothetical protein